MTCTYVQRGESLDYKNEGSALIEAGDVVVIDQRIGIAGADIPVGEVGAIEVCGVFTMPKTASTAIAMGAPVYFDGTGIAAAAPSSGVTAAVGYAAAAAAADATEIAVKLVG